MSSITPRDIIADAIAEEGDHSVDNQALNVLLTLRDEYGTTLVNGHHYILIPHIGLDAYPKPKAAA